ncbi:MAG TPA: BACON domain-containing carbohydrate-binding protein [Candidatus Acidoferrales bacterium]|jgi:uncharacterized protein (TIGR03437 family)|nr:BACON domain-containing carbohydrate-binding protein [Candidatus Acidoferrales bacterium]
MLIRSDVPKYADARSFWAAVCPLVLILFAQLALGATSVIRVSPNVLNFTYQSGGTIPPSQAFNASAPGASCWIGGYGGDWLSVNPSTSIYLELSPTTFDVYVNPAGLNPGTYNGAVTFIPIFSGWSSQSVAIVLVVTSAPSPGLAGNRWVDQYLNASTTQTATFSYQVGSQDPAPKGLGATNINPCTLTGPGQCPIITSFQASTSASWLTVNPLSGPINELPAVAPLSVAVHPSGLPPGAYSGLVTITSPDGNLYVNVALTVTKPTIGTNPQAYTIYTIAGNGTQSSSEISTFGGDNGPATNAELDRPSGVAVDSGGNLYIADGFNNRIRKVSNGVITTVAGDGTSGFTGTPLGDNGPATSAQLRSPQGVAVDSAGNLYIADFGDGKVRKVTNAVITTVAGNGTVGSSGDNGPATSAQLAGPAGVAVDSGGNLYIADFGDGRIRKVSNGVITTVAGNGTFGSSGDNGPATSAQLAGPQGVAVDSAGNLYITEIGYTPATRIRKVSNGVITTIAGDGTSGFSGDNGPATSAELNNPEGVAVDSAGNLFIADTVNHRIRKVSNGVITTVAGNGLGGFSGDNGPATSAELAGPYGVAVDSAGNLYIADTSNNRIRILTPTNPSCSYSVAPASLQATAAGGNLTVAIQTAANCPWEVSGLPSWITVSSATFGTVSAAIPLAVAANPGAARTATISIANSSVEVTQQNGIPVPSINPGGIVNAASSAAGSMAPGSIATVYGSFLLNSLSTAASSPLPNSLAGLSMQVGDGLKVPLFAASSGQVNFQIPWELAGQSQTSLSASISGQTSAVQTLNLAPFAPGIFSMNARGSGQGAILDSSYRLVDSSSPATAGSTVIQIYCTGLGAVTNQPPSGSSALSNPLSLTTTNPTVVIGGVPALVLFSGLAPGSVGEYQVDALVPAGSPKGGGVPVEISIGSAASNTVTIAVQ